MQFRNTLLAIIMGAFSIISVKAYAVTIEVAYPYSALFDTTFKRMMPLFKMHGPAWRT